MITYLEALASYAGHAPRLPTATLPLEAARGLPLAADLTATQDSPTHPTSAMDGWAVRAQDTRHTPHTLEIVGALWAGQDPATLYVGPGQAARIATGALLPPGADAIVRSEDATVEGARLQLTQAVEVGRDVRQVGEQLGAGARLASAGELVTPGMIAALAMQGITHIEVITRPRVELLTCGDELVAPGSPRKAWQHFEGNSAMILAQLATRPVTIVGWTHLPDQEDALLGALERAQARADVLITTGGASVGAKDLWRACGQRLGAQEHFWRVAQRPGKPMFFSRLGQLAWLGLPGTPHAVLTAMATHLTALLGAVCGQSNQAMRLPLQSDAQAHPTMTRHELARLDSSGEHTTVALLSARPLHEQMAQAQAVVVIPAGQALRAGQPALVYPLYSPH